MNWFQVSGVRFHVLLVFALASPRVMAEFEADIRAMLPASAVASNVEVRAADEAAAQRGMVVLQKLNEEICRSLIVTAHPPRLVAWFGDATTWTNFVTKSGFSPNNRSLAGEKFIAVYVPPGDPGEMLAHELVHSVLKEASRGPLPLWFEEGLASHYGWVAARSAASLGGRNLVRTLPPLEEAEWIALKDLVDARKYPDDDAANRAFYRVAEEFVRLLEEKLGPDGLTKLSSRLAKNRDPFDVLRDDFGYSDDGLKMLERAVKVRAMTRQER